MIYGRLRFLDLSRLLFPHEAGITNADNDYIFVHSLYGCKDISAHNHCLWRQFIFVIFLTLIFTNGIYFSICQKKIHSFRAAAYTQIQKYSEATRDCLKSIEIDPNYSKAYSRLGLALYDQGNYRDAIDKGFMKGWWDFKH